MVGMLVRGPHAVLWHPLLPSESPRDLGGRRGPSQVPGLCQPRASPLVITSRRVSLRAGEMPARFGAAAGHPHLQQDGQEGQLCPHLRLQGPLSARYPRRCHRRHRQGGPHFPAWPKLGRGERSGCTARVQSTRRAAGARERVVAQGGSSLRVDPPWCRIPTAGCWASSPHDAAMHPCVITPAEHHGGWAAAPASPNSHSSFPQSPTAATR